MTIFGCWWQKRMLVAFFACLWYSIGHQYHKLVINTFGRQHPSPKCYYIDQDSFKTENVFSTVTISNGVLIYNFILFILLFDKIIKLIKYDLITNYFLCSSFMCYELCRTGCSTQKVIMNSWILTLELTVFRSDIETLERCETWK